MTLQIKEDVSYLLDMADVLQKEATLNNIISVFDDGGYRELLLTKMFGLSKMEGRHGDDGIDESTGNKYELKTVNLIDTKGKLRTKPKITTCHHFNHEIIARYRAVTGFLVGIFYINEPARIYEVPASELEHSIKAWEDKLNASDEINHINNPKFDFKDIVSKGNLIYQDPKYDVYFEAMSTTKIVRKAFLERLDNQIKDARQVALEAKELELKAIKEAAIEIAEKPTE